MLFFEARWTELGTRAGRLSASRLREPRGFDR